ncbi:hypothetical protein JXR93_08950 [bacterium]|nr:hypothetical protein [bacterium]
MFTVNGKIEKRREIGERFVEPFLSRLGYDINNKREVERGDEQSFFREDISDYKIFKGLIQLFFIEVREDVSEFDNKDLEDIAKDFSQIELGILTDGFNYRLCFFDTFSSKITHQINTNKNEILSNSDWMESLSKEYFNISTFLKSEWKVDSYYIKKQDYLSDLYVSPKKEESFSSSFSSGFSSYSNNDFLSKQDENLPQKNRDIDELQKENFLINVKYLHLLKTISDLKHNDLEKIKKEAQKIETNEFKVLSTFNKNISVKTDEVKLLQQKTSNRSEVKQRDNFSNKNSIVETKTDVKTVNYPIQNLGDDKKTGLYTLFAIVHFIFAGSLFFYYMDLFNWRLQPFIIMTFFPIVMTILATFKSLFGSKKSVRKFAGWLLFGSIAYLIFIVIVINNPNILYR